MISWRRPGRHRPYSQAHISLSVRRRGLDESHIYRQKLSSYQIGKGGEGGRCAVGRLPCAYRSLIAVLNQLKIQELLGVIFDIVQQRSGQGLGPGTGGAYEYPVPWIQQLEYLLWWGELLREGLRPEIPAGASIQSHISSAGHSRVSCSPLFCNDNW